MVSAVYQQPSTGGHRVGEARRARAAFDENPTHYQQQIPALSGFNALLIASNGTDTRVSEVEGLTYGTAVTGNMEIRNLVQP